MKQAILKALLKSRINTMDVLCGFGVFVLAYYASSWWLLLILPLGALSGWLEKKFIK